MIVYTAVAGTRDHPRSDIRCIKAEKRFHNNPCMDAKIYKILPHLFFPLKEGDWTIWIDANVYLKVDVQLLIDKVRNARKDIGVFKHEKLQCLYAEAATCKRRFKNQVPIINEQIQFYNKQKYPMKNGLVACFLIVRRNCADVRSFCEEWWAQITRFSFRDQISFPYVASKYKNILYMSGGHPWKENYYFTRPPHANDKKVVVK
jgi:hypothetical protein